MRSPRSIVRSVLIGITLTGMGLGGAGCATISQQHAHRALEIVEPAGPGSVFATIDEAVVDGLAYAYRESGRVDRRAHRDHRPAASGGTVYRAEHAYSYHEPRSAPHSDPDRVEIVLREQDVAHFATYRAGTPDENKLNETHSEHDRRNVDELDPRHRPSFILTPSLKVRGYGGPHSEFVATIVTDSNNVASTD